MIFLAHSIPFVIIILVCFLIASNMNNYDDKVAFLFFIFPILILFTGLVVPVRCVNVVVEPTDILKNSKHIVAFYNEKSIAVSTDETIINSDCPLDQMLVSYKYYRSGFGIKIHSSMSTRIFINPEDSWMLQKKLEKALE